MFNPSRLTLARQRRGLTKTRLAKMVDVTVRSITAYETGETVPMSDTIQRLSLALAFPSPFFFADDIEMPQQEGVSFRSLKSMTAGKRDAALGASALAIELGTWIDERFSLPEPNVPDFLDSNPEAAAEAVRSEWGLGEKPIPNIIHLLEAHGIRVFSLAEECLEVDAFSFWRNDIPYVFLNTQKTGERSRLDAAHELGHLVLHRYNHSRDRNIEREAQQFAGSFLMPRSNVLATISGLITIPRLVKLKHIWNVSVSALTYRLNELNLLTEWQYRTLFKELSARGFRKNEPDSNPRETSQVFTKIFDLLRKEGFDKRLIAKDLHLFPEDINALVFGLAFLSVKGGSPNRIGSPSDKPHLQLVLSPEKSQ